MRYNPEIHHRISMRLSGYDYSSLGHYFVTINVGERECVFGEIRNDVMIKSPIGEMAEKFWYEIPLHFPHIILDEFVVMPNHIHGIIEIANKSHETARVPVGVGHVQPLREPEREPEPKPIQRKIHTFQHMIPQSISTMVGGYKFAVTKWCNQNDNQHFSWQRNFYDRIITTDEQLQNTRNYIRNNPRMWKSDSEFIDM